MVFDRHHLDRLRSRYRSPKLAADAARFVTGAVIVAVAVAVMLWNDLGAGPLDVLVGAIRVTTGIPLAFAVWTTIGTLTLTAWGLGRRPGPGTVAAPLVVGPTMQVALEVLEASPSPNGLLFRIVVHVVAIGAVGFGSALLIVSGLGAGTNELLTTAASERIGQPEPRVRLGFEVAWVMIGAVLGGPIGIGTVLFAALIGSSVDRGVRWAARGPAGHDLHAVAAGQLDNSSKSPHTFRCG